MNGTKVSLLLIAILIVLAGCSLFQPPDSDGDGIPNQYDQCPNKSGPWSGRGCPFILITEAIAFRPVSHVGEILYTNIISIDYQSGPLVLSQDPAGSADFMVDDAMDLRVVHPDGTVSNHTIDTSFNCSRFMTPVHPQNIAHLFRRGINEMHVIIYDKCGENGGTTKIYLVNM